jgi:hypothetical protein
MVLKAHVRNGKVIVDDGATLPEGAELRIEVVAPASDERPNDAGPSLYERLKPIIGQAKGMPADAARNLDHYLYGHPKQ